MNTKININVIVPDEIRYAFDTDSVPTFFAVRESGRIVIKALCDIGTRKAAFRCVSDYQESFMEGIKQGYDDGYHRGFCDAAKHNAYNANYTDSEWLTAHEASDFCGDDSFCEEGYPYDEFLDDCQYDMCREFGDYD